MKFRKKGIVEAVQVTEEWFTDVHPNPLHPIGVTLNTTVKVVSVPGLTHTAVAKMGDWIVLSKVRYVIKDEKFKELYEKINPIVDALPVEVPLEEHTNKEEQS